MTDRRIYIWDKFSSQKAPKHEKKIVLGCICNAKNLEAQRFCSFSNFEIDLAHLHIEIMQSLNILKRPQKFQPISNLI